MILILHYRMHSLRINRYIVGCKLYTIPSGATARVRINRYIVGCKFTMSNDNGSVDKRINRYIVGCK